MKLRGFTMIEILVVLVIMGVLAVLGGGTYVKSLSRGRDARRLEDMKTIQKGFEVYYAKYGSYSMAGNTCDAMLADKSVFPNGSALTDPTPSRSYTSTCNNAAQSYCYCAALDNGAQYGNSTDALCTYTNVKADALYYCVNNVQ